jgi:N-dimethylarginine dimethylaminohydrolase
VSVVGGVEAEWDRLAVVAVVRPAFFALTEPINLTQRHFYGTADEPTKPALVTQHAKVTRLLTSQGIQVLDVAPTPGLPFQFNVRDAAAVIGPRFILLRMARAARVGEPAILGAAITVQKAHVVSAGTLEGGDLMVTPTEVFVGLSERTDPLGYESLRELLTGDRRITPIRLTKGTLHLDVALNLIGPNLGLIHRPSIGGDLPNSLRDIQWIEVTDDEFTEQAVNILVLEPNTVIMDTRHERIHSDLTARGFRCLPVELDEITKVGGGVRCMTLPLARVRAEEPSSAETKLRSR